MSPDGEIDPRILAGLDWCQTQQIKNLTVAIPFPVSEAVLLALSERAGVVSFILSQDRPPALEPTRAGQFIRDRHTWTLPARLDHRILYVGAVDSITARMIRTCLISKAHRIVCWHDDAWQCWSVSRLAMRKLGAKIRAAVLGLAYKTGLVKMIDRDYLDKYQAALQVSVKRAPASPSRVVMACPTLVAGGSERQLLNTALGLQANGLRDITVLVSNLHATAGNNFFLQPLIDAGLAVKEISGPAGTLDEWVNYRHDPELLDAVQRLRTCLKGLPEAMVQEIIDTLAILTRVRPAVVHCWLDHSNIRAGLAALVAGVPRIVISGRNVSPVHVPYIYHPYLRAGYQALAARPEVVFINNSVAGMEDYARWLGLPAARFRVVYNGIAAPPPGETNSNMVERLRARLGIPPDAFLVGGMFRLSEEKNPMLWLEAAVALLAMSDNYRFVVFGEGPLRTEMERFISGHRLDGRIQLRPPTPDSHSALAAFDVLLLTSKWEGTPNVAIEAQALGTPVVISGGGGAAEALLDGATGVFVPTPAAPPLATAVHSLAVRPELHRQMRTEGPRFVQARFGMARMISETMEIYAL